MELIIFSILGWGLAATLGGLVAKRASVASLMFWGPFISSPLVAIPLLFGGSIEQPGEVFLLVLLSYLSLMLAWSFYWRALKIAETSLVVALGATYPLVSLFLFLLFADVGFNLLLLLGSLLVSLGVFLLHLENKKDSALPLRALLFSLLAATSWGFWGFFDWQSLQYAGPFDVMIIFFLFSPILPLFLYLLKKTKKARIDLTIDRNTVLLRFASSISATIALLSLYYTLANTEYPTVAIALAATYPLAALFFLVLLNQEKVTSKKALSILVVVVGVIVLQIYGAF